MAVIDSSGGRCRLLSDFSVPRAVASMRHTLSFCPYEVPSGGRCQHCPPYADGESEAEKDPGVGGAWLSPPACAKVWPLGCGLLKAIVRPGASAPPGAMLPFRPRLPVSLGGALPAGGVQASPSRSHCLQGWGGVSGDSRIQPIKF